MHILLPRPLILVHLAPATVYEQLPDETPPMRLAAKEIAAVRWVSFSDLLRAGRDESAWEFQTIRINSWMPRLSYPGLRLLEAPGTRTILASGDDGREEAEAELMRAVAVADDGESLIASATTADEEQVEVQPLVTAPYDAALAAATDAQNGKGKQDLGELHFLLWGLTLRLVGRILIRMGEPELNTLVNKLSNRPGNVFFHAVNRVRTKVEQARDTARKLITSRL